METLCPHNGKRKSRELKFYMSILFIIFYYSIRHFLRRNKKIRSIGTLFNYPFIIGLDISLIKDSQTPSCPLPSKMWNFSMIYSYGTNNSKYLFMSELFLNWSLVLPVDPASIFVNTWFCCFCGYIENLQILKCSSDQIFHRISFKSILHTFQSIQNLFSDFWSAFFSDSDCQGQSLTQLILRCNHAG